MTPRRKAQTPILPRRILKRIPPAHGARRIRIQKRAILVRRHRAPDLGLLAYDHRLQHAWVPEPEGVRDGGVAGGEGSGAEGGRELVQVVPDFVDGEVFGFG